MILEGRRRIGGRCCQGRPRGIQRAVARLIVARIRRRQGWRFALVFARLGGKEAPIALSMAYLPTTGLRAGIGDRMGGGPGADRYAGRAVWGGAGMPPAGQSRSPRLHSAAPQPASADEQEDGPEAGPRAEQPAEDAGADDAPEVAAGGDRSPPPPPPPPGRPPRSPPFASLPRRGRGRPRATRGHRVTPAGRSPRRRRRGARCRARGAPGPRPPDGGARSGRRGGRRSGRRPPARPRARSGRGRFGRCSSRPATSAGGGSASKVT